MHVFFLLAVFVLEQVGCRRLEPDVAIFQLVRFHLQSVTSTLPYVCLRVPSLAVRAVFRSFLSIACIFLAPSSAWGTKKIVLHSVARDISHLHCMFLTHNHLLLRTDYAYDQLVCLWDKMAAAHTLSCDWLVLALLIDRSEL